MLSMPNVDVAGVVVQLFDESNPLALYCHYPDESDPQPCDIKIDLETGELWAAFAPERSPSTAVPARVRSYRMPLMTAAAANNLLRELAPLAARIIAGGSVEWTGSNHVSVLDEDGQDAEAELMETLDAIAQDSGRWPGLITELDAEEWFTDDVLAALTSLTADTTDAQLAQLATEQERKAASGHLDGKYLTLDYLVLVDAESCLAVRREQLRNEVRAQAVKTAKSYKDLETKRNELIKRMSGFGDSSREIAERVGLTHTAVQNIARRPEPQNPATTTKTAKPGRTTQT